jgi:hypothetical protein
MMTFSFSLAFESEIAEKNGKNVVNFADFSPL